MGARESLLVVVSSLFLLQGCGGERIVGRYEEGVCTKLDDYGRKITEKCVSEEFLPKAAVNLTSVATVQPPGGPACGGFEKEAAAECVKALAAKTTTPGEFIGALATPLKERSADVDHTRFERTFAITIRKDGFNPSDRLEMVDLEIVPEDGTFASWLVARSTYTEIDLGKVSITQKRDASLSITGSAPATALFPLQGTAQASASNQRDEEFAARRRIEELTVSIVPGDGGRQNLRIYQQGATGRDLTGTILVSAVVATTGATRDTPVVKIGGYVDKGASIAAQDLDVRLSAQSDKAFARKPIKATIKMSYALRHVKAGDQTLEERDDRAEYYVVKADDSKTVLVPLEEMGISVYQIYDTVTGDPVRIGISPGANNPPLCFATRAEAAAFIRYLDGQESTPPKAIGPYPIGLPDLKPDAQGKVDPNRMKALNPGAARTIGILAGCG